jgi:hypothetical protein
MSVSANRPPRISAVVCILAALAFCPSPDGSAQSQTRRVVFDGVKSEQRWTLKELNPEWPSDWSGWNYLVLEMKTSTPQRFAVWL